MILCISSLITLLLKASTYVAVKHEFFVSITVIKTSQSSRPTAMTTGGTRKNKGGRLRSSSAGAAFIFVGNMTVGAILATLGTHAFVPSRRVIRKGAAIAEALLREKSPGYATSLTSSGHDRSYQSSPLMSAAHDDNAETSEKKGAAAKKPRKKGKVKINPNWRTEANLDALAAEFDKMARRDGFDSSMSIQADASIFEDDFDYDGLSPMMSDDDLKAAISKAGQGDDETKQPNDLIDLGAFDPSDFDDEGNDDDDDDFLDFGTDLITDDSSDDGRSERSSSMAERIAAASRDMDLGRITVDEELDGYAKDASEEDIRKLGFRREVDPFGNDETPRKRGFTLVTNAMTCSACGTGFQCKREGKPGFLPQNKYETQVKLSKIEELQNLQNKADSNEWSSEDEIEFLIQSEGGGEGGWDGGPQADLKAGINIEAMAEEMEIDLIALTQKKVICKRCHGLQNFGDVTESLRPGWTEEPLLSQEAFRNLLKPIGEKAAVIIALVDLFDFSGSVLPELDDIAKDNPVILAANKADLLPSEMGQNRAENWVRREMEYLGVESLANIGGAVRLISCKTGFGVSAMLEKARKLAEDMECDIYIIGAANAGKSTLLNHILAKNDENSAAMKFGKKRRGNANAHKGAVTTSPLPGTTLKFIEVDLGDGLKLYDTPGLLVPGTLTQRLTPAELKMVVPKT